MKPQTFEHLYVLTDVSDPWSNLGRRYFPTLSAIANAAGEY